MAKQGDSTGRNDKVKLETMARTNAIPSTVNYESFPVLVRVTAPYECTERPGIDLVAVLDVSSSMNHNNRLESMKEAMMFIIDNLGTEDRLSIVSFDRRPTRVMELTEMSDNANRKKARDEVIKLRTGHGTKMGKALKEAATILEERGGEEISSSRVGRIIFLSDGEEKAILRQDIRSAFPAEIFGLGADHDPEVLRYIADQTYGTYSYINEDLGNITEAFAQSIGGLTSIAAVDLQIDLQPQEGVTISSIESGNYPKDDWSRPDKQEWSIYVHDLYAGEQKSFIVFLTVPKGDQQRLMTVGGWWYRRDPADEDNVIRLDDSEVVVLRPSEIAPAERVVCPDVAAELIRLRLVKGVADIVDNHAKGDAPLELWDRIRSSEDGREAPESTKADLSRDVNEMHKEGQDKPFTHSWLTSHMWQRATTKGAPSKSPAFRIKAMEEMIEKVPKGLPEQTVDSPSLETSAGQAVKLETMTVFKSIPWAKSCNDFPVLLRVTALEPPGDEETSPAGVDLVAVLDISEGMAVENRLENMKEAMKLPIQQLGQHDRLCVVSFNKEVQLLMELSYMSDENQGKAMAEVDKLMASGDNDGAGAAMQVASLILGQRGEKEKSSRDGRVIVLSDNEDNAVPAETSGLGANEEPKVMRRYIADKNSHSHGNPDPDKIKDALDQSIIRSGPPLIATALQINLQTHEGVAISSIESGSHCASFTPEVRSSTIQIQELRAGEEKNFVVYLTVPEGKEQLLNIWGAYRHPSLGEDTASVQLDYNEIAIPRPKENTSVSDKAVYPEEGPEFIWLRLTNGVPTMVEHRIDNRLHRLWDVLRASSQDDRGTMSSDDHNDMEIQKKQKSMEHQQDGIQGRIGQDTSPNDKKENYVSQENTPRQSMKGNNESAIGDASQLADWPMLVKDLEVNMLNKMDDKGIASFLHGDSVEDMSHATNRYLYLALMYASALGSRCRSLAIPAEQVSLLEQKIERLEREKKDLLVKNEALAKEKEVPTEICAARKDEELDMANARIGELERPLQDKKSSDDDHLLELVAKTDAHMNMTTNSERVNIVGDKKSTPGKTWQGLGTAQTQVVTKQKERMRVGTWRRNNVEGAGHPPPHAVFTTGSLAIPAEKVSLLEQKIERLGGEKKNLLAKSEALAKEKEEATTSAEICAPRKEALDNANALVDDSHLSELAKTDANNEKVKIVGNNESAPGKSWQGLDAAQTQVDTKQKGRVRVGTWRRNNVKGSS